MVLIASFWHARESNRGDGYSEGIVGSRVEQSVHYKSCADVAGEAADVSVGTTILRKDGHSLFSGGIGTRVGPYGLLSDEIEALRAGQLIAIKAWNRSCQSPRA